MREADWTAREVCARAGAVVVSVDYRLAVDGVCYPVPHDDTRGRGRPGSATTPQALGVDAGRIAVGGASAGANLTAGAVLKLRDRDGWLPAALVFVYGGRPPGRAAAVAGAGRAARPSCRRCSRRRPGSRDDFLTVNYLGGPHQLADGYAMPALAVLDGLCPTVVVNAEYDDLRASGEAFAAALALAGVDVRQVLVRACCTASSTCRPSSSRSAGAST